MESKSSESKAKKSTTLRTRKSLGKAKKNTKRETDDEFQPSALATKTKAKAKEETGNNNLVRKRVTKPKPRISVSDDMEGQDDGPSKKKTDAIKSEDDSEVHVSKRLVKGKGKASPKRKVLVQQRALQCYD